MLRLALCLGLSSAVLLANSHFISLIKNNSIPQEKVHIVQKKLVAPDSGTCFVSEPEGLFSEIILNEGEEIEELNEDHIQLLLCHFYWLKLLCLDSSEINKGYSSPIFNSNASLYIVFGVLRL